MPSLFFPQDNNRSRGGRGAGGYQETSSGSSGSISIPMRSTSKAAGAGASFPPSASVPVPDSAPVPPTEPPPSDPVGQTTSAPCTPTRTPPRWLAPISASSSHYSRESSLPPMTPTTPPHLAMHPTLPYVPSEASSSRSPSPCPSSNPGLSPEPQRANAHPGTENEHDAERPGAIVEVAEGDGLEDDNPEGDDPEGDDPEGDEEELPFSTSRLPTQRELWEASLCEVMDEDGNHIRFGDLYPAWPDNLPPTPRTRTVRPPRTVVLFIRAFLCGQCQDYMLASVSRLDPEVIAAANVRMVIIGNGSWKGIKKYREIVGCPFPIYVDAPRRLYRLLGMTPKISKLQTLQSIFVAPKDKASYHQHGPFSQVLHGAARAARLGLVKMGSITQMGGEFVLAPAYRCDYAHRMANKFDHALAPDVLRAAGVLFPEHEQVYGPVCVSDALTDAQLSELRRLEAEMTAWREEQELQRARRAERAGQQHGGHRNTMRSLEERGKPEAAALSRPKWWSLPAKGGAAGGTGAGSSGSAPALIRPSHGNGGNDASNSGGSQRSTPPGSTRQATRPTPTFGLDLDSDDDDPETIGYLDRLFQLQMAQAAAAEKRHMRKRKTAPARPAPAHGPPPTLPLPPSPPLPVHRTSAPTGASARGQTQSQSYSRSPTRTRSGAKGSATSPDRASLRSLSQYGSGSEDDEDDPETIAKLDGLFERQLLMQAAEMQAIGKERWASSEVICIPAEPAALAPKGKGVDADVVEDLEQSLPPGLVRIVA